MTDNLPLLAILAFVLFVGGFLAGFGLSAWLRASEGATVDETDSVGA